MVVVDLVICLFQFNLVGMLKFISLCDIVKSVFVKVGLNYENVVVLVGMLVEIKVGDMVIQIYDGKVVDVKMQGVVFDKMFVLMLKGVGYLVKVDLVQFNWLMMIVILIIFVIFVMMVYGLIVVMLVEMFLMWICYMLMLLFYYIGNGWFGGFLLVIVFVIVVVKGNIYLGFWYLIVIVLVMFVIGLLFVKEMKDLDIYVQD